MPLNKHDPKVLDRFYFNKPGECSVRVGPCSSAAFRQRKIPLDGRHYLCGGKVIFKNGIELSATIEIRTHTFDFLVSAWCDFGDCYWQAQDPELHSAMGVSTEDALPFTWLPDPPLDYSNAGPYPQSFYGHRE